MTDGLKPGRALVFIRAMPGALEPKLQGPILDADGAFAAEVQHGGNDMADHSLMTSSAADLFWARRRAGLLVFEGWLEHTSGPDPDVHWIGQWRALTLWEMCLLRAGEPLWKKAPR